MKTLETILYENKTFAVLVETMPDDDTKGYVSYFIEGSQITDCSKLITRYQRLFTTLADNLCEGLAVIKWSY
jgi:tetrahydromethanopterin S-methyltransferase subunit F